MFCKFLDFVFFVCFVLLFTIVLQCEQVGGKSSSSSSSSSDEDDIFTLEEFNVFKSQVLELLNCDATLSGDNACQGLTREHPDVSVYDRLGSDVDGPIASNLIRLAFHDCGGVDPYFVSLGESEFFVDGSINGYVGGCNGCIGINTNAANDNLLDGIIDIIEPICSNFSYIISRADCWMLAATIAVEHASEHFLNTLANPPFLLTIEAAVKEGEIPYYYGRSDCENGYVSGEVDFPFSNPKDVVFTFPTATLGWTHMSDFLKGAFDWNNGKCGDSSDDEGACVEYFTNQDIMGLLSGGHSIGRAHEKISGFSGPWDFTDEILENSFITMLLGESIVASESFGINVVWNQSIINPNQNGSLPQWAIEMPPAIIFAFGLNDPDVFDPPLLRLLLALNTDFSMVYDISYYIENDLENDIDCVSNAALLCDENDTILTAPRGVINSKFNTGKTSEELGEQTECGNFETCCQFIQCPIQCEGGINEYNRLIENVTRLMNDDSESFISDELINCPAALAKRYSEMNSRDVTIGNRNMGRDFANAWIKMITLGYLDANSDSSDSSDSSDDSEMLLRVVE